MGPKVTLIAFLIFQFAYKGTQKLAASSPISGTNETNVTRNTQSDSQSPTLPEQFATFDSQVAGHSESIFKDSGGYILKLSQQKELDFYGTLEKTDDPDLTLLKQFVRNFIGKIHYIRIEDIADDFVYPCAMDVKIGKQTWEPDEKEEKIRDQESKYPEMRARFELGIMGYQYYDMSANKEFLKHGGKSFVNKMTPAGGIEAMFKFVNGELGLQAGVVDGILAQLREISSWFKEQKRYNFFGSSILLAYDAQTLESGKHLPADSPMIRVRLIDFSHATPVKIEDKNCTKAIENLINLLENLEDLYAKEVQGEIRMLNDQNESEKSVEQDISLSSGNETSHEHQLGGHPGIVMDSEGFILKPVLARKEMEFYDTLAQTQDPKLLKLKQFTPNFGGSVTYLRLEDLTRNFTSPSVIGIKIGYQIWEPTASAAEVAIRNSAYVEMREYWKFCIPGMKYYDITDKKWVTKDESDGRKMKPNDAVKVLYRFVNGKLGAESGLVGIILERLKEINSWFKHPISYKFYESSILIVYDAESVMSGKTPEVRVKMIDFSHAVPNSGKSIDENYALGLRNLIEVFQNVEKLD